MLSSGCATSTTVEEAPLEASRQQKLRKSLVGTWRQTHVIVDGSRKPVESTPDIWTFRKNGSGTHRVGRASNGEEGTSFQWSLEGRNLVIELESGTTTHVRAEAWSALQMKWFHYTDETYSILRPAGDSVRKAPGTRMSPGEGGSDRLDAE